MIKNEFITDKNKQDVNILKNEQGQSLVEFVLLLASILLVSMVFMKIVNGNIGKYWTAMGQTLLLDVEGSQKLNLR
jgi:Flp pilus assembly pilin Flp